MQSAPSGQLAEPDRVSHALATASGSCLPLHLASSDGQGRRVSFADTALHASVIVGVDLRLVTSGTICCAANMFFGSVRDTKSFAAIDGSVEKMSAASIVPFFSAVDRDRRAGRASGVNVPNVTP